MVWLFPVALAVPRKTIPGEKASSTSSNALNYFMCRCWTFMALRGFSLTVQDGGDGGRGSSAVASGHAEDAPGRTGWGHEGRSSRRVLPADARALRSASTVSNCSRRTTRSFHDLSRQSRPGSGRFSDASESYSSLQPEDVEAALVAADELVVVVARANGPVGFLLRARRPALCCDRSALVASARSRRGRARERVRS